MKKSNGCALTLLLTYLITGCGGDSSLDGVWSSTYSSGFSAELAGLSAELGMNFNTNYILTEKNGDLEVLTCGSLEAKTYTIENTLIGPVNGDEDNDLYLEIVDNSHLSFSDNPENIIFEKVSTELEFKMGTISITSPSFDSSIDGTNSVCTSSLKNSTVIQDTNHDFPEFHIAQTTYQGEAFQLFISFKEPGNNLEVSNLSSAKAWIMLKSITFIEEFGSESILIPSGTLNLSTQVQGKLSGDLNGTLPNGSPITIDFDLEILD